MTSQVKPLLRFWIGFAVFLIWAGCASAPPKVDLPEVPGVPRQIELM